MSSPLTISAIATLAAIFFLAQSGCTPTTYPVGATGDLGVVVERAKGRIKLINTSTKQDYASVGKLGDLSHASVVFSRDQRFAYIFGRDGGLSKIDLLSANINKRIIQSGNSIGGAISQDGKLIAVSNYSPGGVKVFHSDTLALVADIPASPIVDARTGEKKFSKVVGLVDAPGQKFVFSLFDSHEIWIADFSTAKATAESNTTSNTAPVFTLQKFAAIGRNPYDALITPDGRYYIAGLFGEDGLALLDLWHTERGVQSILPNYGRGQQKLPVYKMPHLEGWAIAGNLAFVPAVGQHQVLIIDTQTWKLQHRIPVHGQPVFVMASPDGRQVWVNFAFPNNNTLQVIDVDTLKVIKALQPGPAILHMEFTPRGEHVWVSVRDANQVVIYDTLHLQKLKSLAADSPSGIFFTSRAHKLGL